MPSPDQKTTNLKSTILSTIKTFSATSVENRSELRKQLQQLKKEAEQELAGRTKGKEVLNSYFLTNKKFYPYQSTNDFFNTSTSNIYERNPIPASIEPLKPMVLTETKTNKQICESMGMAFNTEGKVSKGQEQLWDLDDIYSLVESDRLDKDTWNIFMISDGEGGVRSLSFYWRSGDSKWYVRVVGLSDDWYAGHSVFPRNIPKPL